MGGDAVELRLAAAFARCRQRHFPRQCAIADRRLDQPARRLASGRLARRYSVAPHRQLAQPGAVHLAGRGCSFLPPLPPQPDAAGPLSAPDAETIARRPAAAAGGDRAQLCDAVPAGAVRPPAQPCAPPDRGTAAADPARRRTHQPQSRRAHRTAGGPAAAASVVQRAPIAAAAGAQQRHRPHDADAAFLPPCRRQFRAIQRHGSDVGRSARHRARLRRRPRRAGVERPTFRLSAHRHRSRPPC